MDTVSLLTVIPYWADNFCGGMDIMTLDCGTVHAVRVVLVGAFETGVTSMVSAFRHCVRILGRDKHDRVVQIPTMKDIVHYS
jgi:hypothetical protein